ncbi:cell division protein FtsK [Nonomuraea sp. NN258]|uniref:FtsK/SpoIIIE domain-containing protein n=1 Tax=Nonomuraea antri TaxID=2730852 RepID=UPI00156A5CA6|nr:FtsK/SpoIIIE domain-containing protein [Nonomuraea antri]NRQ40596.1 cell division protein FtsK [Nonomuraea antri]
MSDVEEVEPRGAVVPIRRAPAEPVTDDLVVVDLEYSLPSEGEILEVADDVLEGRVLVDQATDPPPTSRLAVLAERRADRPPVVPIWLRSRATAIERIKWETEHVGYIGAYHLVRVPAYAGRLLRRSPRGLGWLLRDVARWVRDIETAPLRDTTVQRGATAEYLLIAKEHRARVRSRLIQAAGALLVAIVGGLLVRLAAPWWVQWLSLGTVLGLLGRYGTASDQRVFDRAVIPARVERLTSDVVVRALGALGIAELNKAAARPDGIEFVAPIREDGPGWRADINLPYGVTAADVMAARQRLASALRRPLGAVWPEPVSDAHPGRLVLWVGHEEMRKQKQPAWPLATAGQCDLFQAIPYGSDQRGRPISVELMFGNVLIGAMPRYGKTFALRVLLMACALDPTAELHLWELKGTGDLKALEQVAHRYGSGAKEETYAAAMAGLREVFAELERRAEVINDLPEDLCPESKVTRRLADTRALRLHPLVLAIDECQELFAHEEFGEEAGRLATAIIKRGPALGIILLLATQRPDKKSLPTSISANAGIRICLRVMGHIETDMILGSGSHTAGIRPSNFTKKDQGISYAVGIDDDPILVRSAYLDAPTSKAIAARARELREQAGTLSGHALGERPPVAPDHDLLLDVLAVVAPDEEKVWNSRVAARLAELRPGAYGQWAGLDDADRTAALTSALKPFGVPVGQVWGTLDDGEGANRRGIARADVVRLTNERRRAKLSA